VSNYIELIIFLLIASSSVISWIFKKMKEQAEIRQRQQQIELQRREALRTGAPLSQTTLGEAPGSQTSERASTASPEERLRELMIERQRRVEELRRRQAQAQAQAQAQSQGQTQSQRQRQTARPPATPPRPQARPQVRTPPGAPTGQGGDNLIVIGPDGKPRLVRRPSRASQQAAQRQSQQTAHQMGQHPAQSGQRGGIDQAGQDSRLLEQRRRQAIALQQERQAYEDAERERLSREAAERERVTVVAARRTGTIGMGTKGVFDARGLSQDQLRQAIVLNEVLAAPISLRDA
jgi:hypothetical protein